MKAKKNKKTPLSSEDLDAINEMVWSGWSRAAAEREVRARIEYETARELGLDK